MNLSMKKEFSTVGVTVRVRRESWNEARKALKGAGISPNKYVSMLIDALAMSGTSTYQQMLDHMFGNFIGGQGKNTLNKIKKK